MDRLEMPPELKSLKSLSRDQLLALAKPTKADLIRMIKTKKGARGGGNCAGRPCAEDGDVQSKKYEASNREQFEYGATTYSGLYLVTSEKMFEAGPGYDDASPFSSFYDALSNIRRPDQTVILLVMHHGISGNTTSLYDRNIVVLAENAATNTLNLVQHRHPRNLSEYAAADDLKTDIMNQARKCYADLGIADECMPSAVVGFGTAQSNGYFTTPSPNYADTIDFTNIIILKLPGGFTIGDKPLQFVDPAIIKAALSANGTATAITKNTMRDGTVQPIKYTLHKHVVGAFSGGLEIDTLFPTSEPAQGGARRRPTKKRPT